MMQLDKCSSTYRFESVYELDGSELHESFDEPCKFSKNSAERDSNDECDRIPSKDRATLFDICALMLSILGHIIDVALDINLMYRYYIHHLMTYFWLTLSFVLTPSIIISLFSIQMYVQDGIDFSHSNGIIKLILIIIFFPFAPIIRYSSSLNFAFKSILAQNQNNVVQQRKQFQRMLKEDSDVALLRIFKCFLEAAPQLVLQIGILLSNYGTDENTPTSFTLLHQLLSIASSFLSLSWCMCAYQRSIRFASLNTFNLSFSASVVLFLWHFFVCISRILSLSIVSFQTIYLTFYTVFVLICHWIIMSMWLYFTTSTEFCYGNKLFDLLFYFVFGLVFIFTYINISKGQTKYRYIFYYSLCFIENLIATLIWIYFLENQIRNSFYYYVIIILNIVSFVVGIVIMLIYYIILHPSIGYLKKRTNTNPVEIS